MLLCSIADIRSRRTTSVEDDPLGALIESVSDTIEDYVGAWLGPRPADPSLTATYLFDVEGTGSSLRLMQGGRRAGIRSLTALGIATSNQPESGGTYTTIPVANVLLRPRPTVAGPALGLTLTSGYFSRAFNGVQATGSFGPASVSFQVREATIALVSLVLTHRTPGLEHFFGGVDPGGGYASERDAILSTLPLVMTV